MRFLLAAFFTVCFLNFSFAQSTIEKTLRKFNNNSVKYIYLNELKETENPILLDTRKKEEYNVSHLKDAFWVGHKNFELDSVLKYYPNKNADIVVYCSIGVRSENIGEKLLDAGYTNVKNLYGGIFEWINQGNVVYNNENNETEKVHAFSKHWGKLLTNGDKIYTSKSKELEKQRN
ncbi:rhodanese-like domain-containing protein [Croceitalea rosinachiae]|uniref:Rhodanese-like domain-containing protein n=1 Tax=Croceitalea rosinachiae TaxID=3075596 RepID=A0ABU3A980_9FLAO|nr:rhodanese-like domain-containing protein [Croceitalea sp. F388]MDT0606739.1 rhodanese-like domain-containing protein [Croceitalea sp. F388]